MIVCDEICKTYNPGLFKKKVRAVDNLSLAVGRGEVFGLIGPNGAGKSTSIRMILGLIRPDSGVVSIRGQKSLNREALRDIGYLPENPYLYDHLTLSELLWFGGKSCNLDRQMITSRSQVLMEKLDLLHAKKRPLRSFSKGMLQRAGICFSLLHNPSVIIFDEPMSGLDPIGRKLVFDLVMDLKSEGKTIFFCSHILNDVERLCDRIGLLNQGQLVRGFSKEDYSVEEERNIFVQTGTLTPEQMEQIEKHGGRIRIDGNGHLVAVSKLNYHFLGNILPNQELMSLEVGRNGCPWRTCFYRR